METAGITKFPCGSCGNRIAVRSRHLGRLIVCPDCGKITHPVGRYLTQSTAGSAASTASPDGQSRPCGNCGKSIGKLQKLNLWKNELVCTSCLELLSQETSPAPTPLAVPPTPTPERLTARVPPSPAIADDWRSAPLGPFARQLRGGLLGALTGLCVAGTALYGALTLLKDVVGLVAGLALGALALVAVFWLFRAMLFSRRPAPADRPVRVTRRSSPLLPGR